MTGTGTTRGFTLTRTVDAPPDVVFGAWTDPDRLRWFDSGTGESDAPIEVDLRVGGAWRQLMVVDDSTRYVTGGVYREIVPGERLVFSFGAVGGWPAIDPERLDDGPVMTVGFDDLVGATALTLTVDFADGVPDARVREWLDTGMREGWGITIDRLVERYAAGD